MRRAAILCLTALAGCTDLGAIGREPRFSGLQEGEQFGAMYAPPFPASAEVRGPTREASLWRASRGSLLGDRRAARRGDILTVVIEIDDSAEISNATDRSRSGQSAMGMPQLLGLPQNLDRKLAQGATMANAVQANGSASYSGDGSVARKEKLALRIAATVVEELPHGVLRIEGQQEVRVNFELRELIVTGYVRPGDVSRLNEITYDKIAGARISYGGRGQITDVQQPRWGQQLTDSLLPF